MTPIPMIVDTDPGIDDAMAIAYAVARPDIELLGLTTVFGNTSVELATRNARWLLERFGAPEVAVARGAAVPRVQAPRPHADFVHGADGLGGTHPDGARVAPDGAAAPGAPDIDASDAADFIVRAARARPGEVRLVAIGPLTNVAEALAREPELPDLLHSLVIMGGTLTEPGNVSPVAEANFLNDPHAADETLARDWPATVVGLDVTHRIMLTDPDLDRLGREAGETGRTLRAASRFYIDFYTARAAELDPDAAREPACAMHDAAAVACAVMPDAFARISGAARVVPDGIAVGQLALDRTGARYPLEHWTGRPAVAACTEVDAARVHADFLGAIVAGHRR